MSVFCLIESKFSEQKSGAEYGDAVFRMGPHFMKSSNGKYFINTRKGTNEKQCQSFGEYDIVHMFGKFTFIKIDGVETIAVCYQIQFVYLSRMNFFYL
jgi:hypothetical protein